MHKIWQILPGEVDEEEYGNANVRVKCYSSIKGEKMMAASVNDKDLQDAKDSRVFMGQQFSVAEEKLLLSSTPVKRQSLAVTLPSHYHLPKLSDYQTEEESKDSGKTSHCKLCNKAFLSTEAIVSTKIIEQSEERFLNHNKYPAKRYRCAVCGDITSDCVAMREHVLYHAKEREITCEDCDNKGDEWKNYVYRCMDCGNSIDDLDHVVSKVLEKYIEENNKKDRRQTYMCLVCSLRTLAEDEMKEHVLGNHIMNAIPCKQCENKEEEPPKKEGRRRTSFLHNLFDRSVKYRPSQ